MVETLRKDSIPFMSDYPVNGMFVIGASNAADMDIPHLPILNRHSVTECDGVVTTCGTCGPGQWILTCRELSTNFADGDVVWVDSRSKRIRTVLSSLSSANTLLVTERCDNRCLFCSQPPNDLEDVELYSRATVALLNFNTDRYVGISGGEPTYNDHAFVSMLRTLHDFGNVSRLHILTNGRKFSDISFARTIQASVEDRAVLWGVPLYGHKASLHDTLVSSCGAFSDTVQGLLNFGEIGQAIELRIVPTQANISFLPHIIRFVTSSFPFVEAISIMNLEPKGWARKNFGFLNVPIRKQNSFLTQAIEIASIAGKDVRLFNYPLCLLDQEIRTFAHKTISDWKNYYPAECAKCRLLDDCGGFFSSATGRFIEEVQPQL